MGGKSTSDSAVLDDKGQEASSSFDLRSWQGLTEVLRVGKDSLSPGEYADFRNLILGYAQQGGDVELRAHIDKIISTFNTANKSEEQKVQENDNAPESKKPSLAHPSGIGVRRMQPRFVVSPSPKVEVVKVPPQAPVIPTPVTQNEVRTTESTPAVSAVIPPVEEKAPTVEPTVEVKVAPMSVPIAPVIEVVPSAPVPASLAEEKARIAQIKREVHEHIGNPAALMDSHNDTGKKYMTALLTALKATGSGNTEGVSTAMRELESAYKALTSNAPQEKVLEEKEETAFVPEPVIVTPPVTPIIEEVEPRSSDIQVETVIPNVPEPVIEAKEEFIPEEKTEVPAVKHSAASTLASILKHEPKSHDIQPAPKVDEAVGREPYLANEKRWESEGGDAFPQTKHAHKGIAATNLDAIKVETGIDASNVAVRQSELSAPEITKELHDLLHEWKIFSGSGLFGIGPGGSEHPLYLKIAQLSMGEVLTGRWDASDPKIVKTIKEYTNAWRHEQGVAHSVDETFEHYLRRVVQRILKRRP